MKRNVKNHRIVRTTKLVLRHETVAILATRQLELVAGGFLTGGCGTSWSLDPICDPT
jgi:hypothetical protein